MKRKKLINWLCLSGIISLVFYILHTSVGAMYYPGYDWMSQAVSDLTAINAPSFMIANGLASVYALFACLNVVLVCIIIQGKGNRALRLGIYLFAVMNWVSAIGYALFPLSDSGYGGTFQDIMHVYVITLLVVMLSIVSLVLIIIGGFKKDRKYKSLGIWAIIALVCMFIGPMGMAIVPKSYFGIVERFSVYSAVVFNAILGMYGFAFFDRIER
ncbi:uncharacterized protein DUF998 [Natranaerovirga pectinivora]|uniref:Uncharacterized protein DUF998 n=1 Tax=Natranaerovirga pectinivora TaxID=682400 RepID=A0A4R3MNI4_9FIRM|nr:DUF998 domain-containing protein [Natranaerovirga pectinivora]TCT16070.1 uncharacterized protein DUF998 [Natranaerovirga pectinivora]